MKMNLKNPIIVTLVLAAFFLLIFLGFYFYQKSQWGIFKHENPNYSFEYPERIKIEALTERDKKDKIDFQAANGGLTEKSFLITLRFEDHLRIAASFLKTDLLPMLANNADNSFPGRYSDYSKASEQNLKINSRDAAEIIFTYTSPAKEKIKQRFAIIIYNPDTAYYFSFQSKESDFDYLNKKYFDKMLRSIKFD